MTRRQSQASSPVLRVVQQCTTLFLLATLAAAGADMEKSMVDSVLSRPELQQLATTTSSSTTKHLHQLYPNFVSPVHSGSRLYWSNSSSLAIPPLGGLFYYQQQHDNHSVTARNGRHLAIGDFAALNAMMTGATIDIPGEFEHDLGNVDPGGIISFVTGQTIENKLRVKNIQCNNVMIGDLIFDVQRPVDTGASSTSTIPLQLKVIDLDLDCWANYHYTLVNHDGSFKLFSRGSDVHVDMTITTSKTSPDDITSQVLNCGPNVVISDIDISTDSVLGTILNTVETLIRGPVRDALNNVVCDELRSVGATTLPDVLRQADAALTPYLLPIKPNRANPLYEEERLAKQQQQMAGSLSNSKFQVGQFMDFQNAADATTDATDLAHFVLQALEEVDVWLGSTINTGNGRSDLGINQLLRDTILDTKGLLQVDMTRGSIAPATTYDAVANPGQGMVLLTSHDQLLQMSVVLDKVAVMGLDSMTHFDTLQAIGAHTLQNKFAWRFLEADIDVTIVLEPSTLPDSLWAVVPEQRKVVENVHLTMKANDIETLLSLFLAIHQTRLGELPLGGLMQSETLLGCAFSTVYQGGNLVSGLDISVDSLTTPTLMGFSSPGLDRVLTEALELMSHVYGTWLLQALPHYAQTDVRDMANELWKDFLASLGVSSSTTDRACRLGQEASGSVDFRDLFLPGDKARAMGGTGTEPYGDIIPMLLEMFHEQLLVPNPKDPHQRLEINHMLLDPLTKAQSGRPGEVHLQEDLLSFAVDNSNANETSSSDILSEIAASLFESFEVRLYDTKLRNINTIIEPTHFLKPSSASPHLLQNQVQFGPIPERPLNASVRVLVRVKHHHHSNGGQQQRKMSEHEQEEHKMDISLSAKSLKLVADILAAVDAQALQYFELQDIADPWCWLATIPAPALTSAGTILAGSNSDTTTMGAKFDAFVADFTSFAFDMQCLNDACAKSSLGALQDLSEIWQRYNVTTHLAERYEVLTTELMTGDYAHNTIARWLDVAPSKCLHRDEYSEMHASYPPLDLPVLSPLSMDTMLFSALSAAQAAFMVLSGGNGESIFSGITLPSVQPAVDVSDPTKRYIDFTENQYGTGSLGELISYLFGQANVLLGVNTDGAATAPSDEGVNSLVKDLLNDQGALELEFQDAALIGDSNLQLRLNSLRVTGLDSFTHFNIFDAQGPQLLQNSLKLASVSLEVDISLVSGAAIARNEQRLVMSMTAQDIEASLPVFVAIDADKLDALQLGSLLEIKNILPCLLTAVDDIHVPSVKMSIGSVTKLMVKGLLPSSSAAFDRSMAAITETFGEVEINEFLGPVVQGVINGMLRSYMKEASCTNIMLEPEPCEESPAAQIPVAPQFLEAACSNSSLITLQGYEKCMEACREAECCWMGDAECSGEPACDGYEHCTGLLGHSAHQAKSPQARQHSATTRCSGARRRTQQENLVASFVDFPDLLLEAALAKEFGGTGESPYGDLFRTALAFVKDLVLDVDPTTGLSSVNQLLIAPLTEAVSKEPGSLIMSDTLVDIKSRVNVGGLDAIFSFRASDAKIQNLDTMGAPIDLFAPVPEEPYHLNNTASVGVVSDRPLRASIRLLLGLEGDEETQLRNDLELTMDLHSVTLVLTALLKLVANEFATFPIGDILNSDCWLAKMPAPPLDRYGFSPRDVEPSAAISEIDAALSKMNLRADCFSCTSPGLRDFDTEGSTDIDRVANAVFDYAAEVLGGKFLQVQIDRALNNAAKRCPHDALYDPNFTDPKYARFESDHESSSTGFLLMILIVTGITLAVFILIVVARRCFVRARHRRLLKSLPDRQLYLLQKEQEREDKREKELNTVTHSLFMSSATIPAVVRFLVPVIILGNIGFFLSGHLSLGATVNIVVQLAGQTIRIDEFFSFSMAQSAIDIWNAGGKPLAALIFIFSGLWPYTKQIITLVLWFAPPSRVSMATRGSTLQWLDTLAKWSMIDIFVLFVSVAGFRVSINSPDVDFLPGNFYAVDLLVVPCWGLYANLLAQLISQISSHFIIYYHRRVVNQATRARRALLRTIRTNDEENAAEGFLDDREQLSLASSSDDEDSQELHRQDRLCDHAFVRPHSDNARLVPRGCVNPFLVFVAVALSALVVVGCILPSYSLEVLGILGVAIEAGNKWEQAVQKHSVFSTAKMLMDQASFLGGVGNYLGLGTLSAVLVLTVLIVPLTQTVSLLVHWYVPMSRKTRGRMESWLEGLQSWQYVEVYIIATVVATWQLGPISQFMINAYCGSLDSTFDMLVYYQIINEEDAQCFQVEASIETAAYLLIASAVLLGFLNTYIGNASRQYFRDIDNKSKRETAVVPKYLSSTLNQDDTSASGAAAGMRGHQNSTGNRRPGLESRGNSFNDEGHSLLEADPLAPPSTDRDYVKPASDPLAQPTNTDGGAGDWQRSDALEKIHPVPVLFTDKFRWTLVQCNQDTEMSSTAKPDPSIGATGVQDDTDNPSEEARSIIKGSIEGDFPDEVPSAAPSTRDDNSLQDGFEEIELGGNDKAYVSDDDEDEVTFKNEVVKISSLEQDWESDSDSDDGINDADTEMGNTYAMSIDTSHYESAAFSLQAAPSEDVRSSELGTPQEEEDDSMLLGSDTEDTFSAVSDQGIPKLRSELADIDRQVSNDPNELDRRLAASQEEDEASSGPSSVFLEEGVAQRQGNNPFEDDDVVQQQQQGTNPFEDEYVVQPSGGTNSLEDEIATASDNDHSDYSFETANSNANDEDEIVVETVDPQPVRLGPRRSSGFPDNNFRGSTNKGNSKLQDAFMS